MRTLFKYNNKKMNRKKKIEEVLKKLLDPSVGSRISEVDLDQLLGQLGEKEVDLGDTESCLINETFFLPWLKLAVDQWKTPGAQISSNILIFVAELAANMCITEKIFIKVNFTGVLEEFIKILRIVPDCHPKSRVKLSYISLISSFLHHKSGIQWIMVTNFWFDIFTMISESPSEEICETSRKFIVRLLEISVTDNEMFCFNVLEMVLAPLKELSSNYLENSVQETVGLSLILNVVNKIFEYLLETSCNKLDFRVLKICLDKFDLEKNLRNLITIVKNRSINFHLNKTLCLVLLFSASEHFLSSSPNNNEHIRIRTVLMEMLVNGALTLGPSYMDLIYFAHVVFKNIMNNAVDRKEINRITDAFHHNMMTFLLCPLTYVVTSMLGIDVTEESDDEFRELLITKIVRGLSPATLLAINKLKTSNVHFSVEDGIVAMKYMTSCSRFYSHDVAITATQKLIYMLVDIVSNITLKPEVMSLLSHEFFAAILDTVTYMVKNFGLDWKDNMETIYLTDVACKFLNMYPWPSKVVVAGLQLLDIGISKMALLIDTPDNNADIEKIIFYKLSNSNSEVRIAAIQVIKTITLKVKNKFESYNTLILDGEFPSFILKVASSDPEVLVKINAIQCLQGMVKIQAIWSYLLSNSDIYQQIQNMYYMQMDGTARSEAITLLKEIFQHQYLPSPILKKIYTIISYALFEDDYTVVKIKSLDFWQQVIDKLLSNQGVIDGTFPSVTFSKSTKRIISFDEDTIKSCLSRVLDELAEMGCLRAFLFALRQNVNEELCTHAMRLVAHFIDLLKTHLFESTNSLNIMPLQHRNDFIIEQISQENSMNVHVMDLTNYVDDFCEELLEMDDGNRATQPTPSFKKNNFVANDRYTLKNEFLKLVCEFENMQKQDKRKKKQVVHFDSVVNFILGMKINK